MRHFLRDDDLTPAEQSEVLQLASSYKLGPYDYKPLSGPQAVALIFDKQTLRTQASFAAGVAELGGYPFTVDGKLAGIGTRESVADVARVLAGQVRAIVWRTYAQAQLVEMAEMSGVPVVNALTDAFHPCQILADLLTIREQRGELNGLVVTFVGDGACNMGNSWLLGGATAGIHVRIASPAAYAPDSDIVEQASRIALRTGGSITVDTDPVALATDADVVMTDTWVSMGAEEESADREAALQPYQLNEALLAHARPNATVLHCLPAYRGKEITAEVLEGPHSAVWAQAENRRHVQKAVLATLMEPAR